ncbi:unnamed protein product [Haemonchus placei]|uniref:Uncharacterized protein n=1 Tax=Haemonchus placei TaxID=6290 RepID=A0A3P7V1V3_HAEPC|nr:unnamed protein product [Haemonchus placei]
MHLYRVRPLSRGIFIQQPPREDSKPLIRPPLRFQYVNLSHSILAIDAINQSRQVPNHHTEYICSC